METTTTLADDLGIVVYIYTYLRPYLRRPATKRTRSMNSIFEFLSRSTVRYLLFL